jgi:hypothetical protein
VDFIKTDIEEQERYMLMYAIKISRKHVPKLAICTYHLPDDSDVLEDLIKRTNQIYNIIPKNSLIIYS